jgi:hypothetical protein
MATKKNQTPIPDGLDVSSETVRRLLLERIAYHRDLIVREEAWRGLPWYRRLLTKP